MVHHGALTPADVAVAAVELVGGGAVVVHLGLEGVQLLAEVREEVIGAVGRASTVGIILVRSDEAEDFSGERIVVVVVAADELGHPLWQGLPGFLLLGLGLGAPCHV